MSKDYNVLTDELRDYVMLYGKKYPVFTSFKNWIKISMLLEEKGFFDGEALTKMLRLCYKKELPPNLGSSIMGMLAFLNGDTDFSVSSDKKRGKRLYSFSDDASLIYASFYQLYGIDLANSDMHWYKFCSLFEGIINENPINAVMRIRALDETEIKNAKTRQKIKELKTKYELKNSALVDVAENISSLF